MPTTRPLKGINLDLIDHKRAQAIAEKLTETNRIATKNPRLSETTIRDAVSMAIEFLATELDIHIDA